MVVEGLKLIFWHAFAVEIAIPKQALGFSQPTVCGELVIMAAFYKIFLSARPIVIAFAEIAEPPDIAAIGCLLKTLNGFCKI